VVPARHHETFAYACELWACRERLDVASEEWIPEALNAIFMADPRVDIPLLGSVLRQSEAAGWSAVRSWVETLSASPQ
jgi:hypothetical protein